MRSSYDNHDIVNIIYSLLIVWGVRREDESDRVKG